jgi:hypothetical protein
MRHVCLSIALALACPAAAQTRKAAKEAKEPAPKKFDFDDDVVAVGVDMPQSEVITAPGKPGFRSLIRVRTTFVPEMIDSAHRR